MCVNRSRWGEPWDPAFSPGRRGEEEDGSWFEGLSVRCSPIINVIVATNFTNEAGSRPQRLLRRLHPSGAVALTTKEESPGSGSAKTGPTAVAGDRGSTDGAILLHKRFFVASPHE